MEGVETDIAGAGRLLVATALGDSNGAFSLSWGWGVKGKEGGKLGVALGWWGQAGW